MHGSTHYVLNPDTAIAPPQVFVCEFEELRSPLRDASSQGGGVHGNAILSKFDMTDFTVVEHTVWGSYHGCMHSM